MAKSKASKQPTTKKKPVTQNDLIIAAVLALILGLGGGYALGVATESSTNEVAHSETGHNHDHGMFMVSAEEAPTVELMVEEDKKSGYNVRIMTTNFEFTPENVNGENVVGEGHAHIYVDGKKVGRVYDEYYHVDENFDGTKEFRVTLNANDHSEYAVNGEVVEATVMVTHDSDAEGHDESHMKDGDHSHSDGSHSHSM